MHIMQVMSCLQCLSLNTDGYRDRHIIPSQLLFSVCHGVPYERHVYHVCKMFCGIMQYVSQCLKLPSLKSPAYIKLFVANC